MRRNHRAIFFHLAYLGMAGAALANSGCLLAVAGVGATAAGAAGYLVYEGGEVVRRYDASYADVRNAVFTALAELGMPVLSEKSAGDGTGTIISRVADDDRVTITLETKVSRIPAEGPLTRVGVRVATWGDPPLSGRILDQVSSHLAYVRPAPGTTAMVPAPTGVVPAVAQSPAPPLATQSPPPPLAGK
jgi:hypothetical protein